MDERRQTLQLINYWKNIKFERELPLIDSFETHLIGNRWLNSMLIFTFSNLQDYKMQFIGSDINDAIYDIKKQNYLPLNKMLSKIKVIINQGNLIIDQDNFVIGDSIKCKYRSCFLPFGVDKRNITHFIIFISSKFEKC